MRDSSKHKTRMLCCVQEQVRLQTKRLKYGGGVGSARAALTCLSRLTSRTVWNQVSQIHYLLPTASFEYSANLPKPQALSKMSPRPQLTHFLCLPLITPASQPQLQASLSKFKDSVTTTKTRELPDGIPEKAVRPLGTLHLTLGVMSLSTPERVDSAIRLLKELDLSVLLSGLNAGESHRGRSPI